MVQSRTLKPVVKLRIPTSNSHPHRVSRVVVVRRTAETHPSPTPQPTPCRLWQGTQGSDGYGWRKIDVAGGNRKSMSMHRWVMQEVLGRPLRKTEIVLHACDNPLCYRVDHLSIGTIADNNADMRAKGRDSKPPVNVFHGECHPMAKLSAHQVRQIRGHRQSGLAIKTIAAMFEVAPSTIRRICNGVTWAEFGDGQPKPPTRDLLAEARERLAAEAEEAAPPPRQRIRPVKFIKKEP
jgi:hypothetical protein